MPRPIQRVQVYAVQDRRSSKKLTRPWIVRWSIEGRHRSRSFHRKVEAERYRSELLRAVHDGVRFDPMTGEPERWQQPLGDLGVHVWARRWVEGEWDEWAARSRKSALEALARFLPLVVEAVARSARRAACVPAPDTRSVDGG